MSGINVLRNKAQRIIESHTDESKMPIVLFRYPGDDMTPPAGRPSLLITRTREKSTYEKRY